MLNSLSGIAAAATGFALGIQILVIAGSLVGVAGLVLTLIMSRAMNRSLADVVLRNFGSAKTDSADIYDGRVTATSPEEVAMVLEGRRQRADRTRLRTGRSPGPARGPRAFPIT